MNVWHSVHIVVPYVKALLKSPPCIVCLLKKLDTGTKKKCTFDKITRRAWNCKATTTLPQREIWNIARLRLVWVLGSNIFPRCICYIPWEYILCIMHAACARFSTNIKQLWKKTRIVHTITTKFDGSFGTQQLFNKEAVIYMQYI